MNNQVKEITFKALEELKKHNIQFYSITVWNWAIKIKFKDDATNIAWEYTFDEPEQLNWNDFIKQCIKYESILDKQLFPVKLDNLNKIKNKIKEGIKENINFHNKFLKEIFIGTELNPKTDAFTEADLYNIYIEADEINLCITKSHLWQKLDLYTYMDSNEWEHSECCDCCQ